MVPHVHGDLCSFLTRPSYGRFRQACVPRSHFKTWVGTIGGAIWLTLPDEDGLFKHIYPFKGANARILIASNIADNAEKMVDKIRREWMDNARLRAAFPELVPDFQKTRWSNSCAMLKRGGVYTEGSYTSVGAGGGVVSQHFDIIIEDDLVYAKKDDFSGQELMPSQDDIDKAIGWHKLVHSLFVHPQQSCIWNIGTRWAPHDLIDYIRTNEMSYSTFELTPTPKDEQGKAIWPIDSDEDCTWPERFNKEALEMIREAQQAKIFECFPAEAPILMADWTTKNIADVKVGDETVGFAPGMGKFKSCLLKGTVNLVEKMEKAVVKVLLDNGDVIRCTADHPWYVNRHDSSHKPYLPARVGGRLYFAYRLNTPSQEQLLDYRYLAGLIDGEGACSHGSVAIGQSKYANPDVYAGIESVLQRLSIPYKVSTVNPNESHVLRNKTIVRGLAQSFVLGGGRQVKGDIVRFGRPAKANRILSTIWKNACYPLKGSAKVISIMPDGVETVYAIGTTTGNYIAYGYATKNTQYLCRPRAGEDVTFDTSYLNQHDAISEYPANLKWFTFVDLASWEDKKRVCDNVVLTGAKDSNHNLWFGRIDNGRFNPTQTIDLMKAHQAQFNSKVLIEEVQYQRSIRWFAKMKMREDGHVYNIDAIKADNSANAKVHRINALEPYVRNGMVHVLRSMKPFILQMEDYPYSRLNDMLDMAGFLLQHSSISQKSVPVTPKPVLFQVTLDDVEKELKGRAKNGQPEYPFEFQLEGNYARFV